MEIGIVMETLKNRNGNDRERSRIGTVKIGNGTGHERERNWNGLQRKYER